MGEKRVMRKKGNFCFLQNTVFSKKKKVPGATKETETRGKRGKKVVRRCMDRGGGKVLKTSETESRQTRKKEK